MLRKVCIVTAGVRARQGRLAERVVALTLTDPPAKATHSLFVDRDVVGLYVDPPARRAAII